MGNAIAWVLVVGGLTVALLFAVPQAIGWVVNRIAGRRAGKARQGFLRWVIKLGGVR